MATEQELLEQQRLEAEKQTILDYQETFASPAGKRTLENLKKKCHYEEIVDCDDSIILAIATGERNAVCHILQALKVDLSMGPRQEKAVENPQPINDGD